MTNRVLNRNDEFQIEQIDGELLLYHAGKTETLFLNETAAMVWYLCDNQRNEQEISELLTASYPEAASQIPSQLSEAIDAYIEFGAMTVE